MSMPCHATGDTLLWMLAGLRRDATRSLAYAVPEILLMGKKKCRQNGGLTSGGLLAPDGIG